MSSALCPFNNSLASECPSNSANGEARAQIRARCYATPLMQRAALTRSLNSNFSSSNSAAAPIKEENKIDHRFQGTSNSIYSDAKTALHSWRPQSHSHRRHSGRFESLKKTAHTHSHNMHAIVRSTLVGRGSATRQQQSERDSTALKSPTCFSTTGQICSCWPPQAHSLSYSGPASLCVSVSVCALKCPVAGCWSAYSRSQETGAQMDGWLVGWMDVSVCVCVCLCEITNEEQRNEIKAQRELDFWCELPANCSLRASSQ